MYAVEQGLKDGNNKKTNVCLSCVIVCVFKLVVIVNSISKYSRISTSAAVTGNLSSGEAPLPCTLDCTLSIYNQSLFYEK